MPRVRVMDALAATRSEPMCDDPADDRRLMLRGQTTSYAQKLVRAGATCRAIHSSSLGDRRSPEGHRSAKYY